MISSTLAAYQKHNIYGAKLGFKDPYNVPDDKALEDATKQVFQEHKRRESQYDALKKLYSEQMEDEFAASLAKDALAEYKDNQVNFGNKYDIQSTRFDDEDYVVITNKEKSDEPPLVLKKKDMDENTPHQAGQDEQKLQSAIDRAFGEHSRKVSQFRSLENSLQGLFGEQIGSHAAQHIMRNNKPNSTNSQKIDFGTGRRGSIQLDEEEEEKQQKAGDSENSQKDQNDAILVNGTDANSSQFSLEKELTATREMVGRMQLEIEDLRKQKIDLLVNTNKAMNQLRDAILIYQSRQK